MVPGPGGCSVKTEQPYCFGPLMKEMIGCGGEWGAEQTVHASGRQKSKRGGGINAHGPLANAHPNHSSTISQKPRCCSWPCPGSFAGRQSQRDLQEVDVSRWLGLRSTCRDPEELVLWLTCMGCVLGRVICFLQVREVENHLARTFYPIETFLKFTLWRHGPLSTHSSWGFVSSGVVCCIWDFM